MPEAKETTKAKGKGRKGEASGRHVDAREPGFKVEDRRHWARKDADSGDTEDDEPVTTHPTLLDEYKQRTEAAEKKLQEYIEAFKQSQADQEAFRTRLNRDVDRRVDLRYSELVGSLLESVDDLDLALSHSRGIPEAEPLAQGVAMARDRFLAALERHGVQQVRPDGEEFDPNIAEAVRVDPVEDPEMDGKVVETIRPGFVLRDQVIRAARVAVGRVRN